MTTPSMSQRWRIQGKKITPAWWFVMKEWLKEIQEGSLLIEQFQISINKCKRNSKKDNSIPSFWLEVCVGEGGWGAAAGWGRAAPSRSWMTWRWSRTRRFPAQRTSSARRSRLPRTSRSCCEPPRRTNTTGQPRQDPKSLHRFHLQLLRVSSGPTATALLCVVPRASPNVFPLAFTLGPHSFPLLWPAPVSLCPCPSLHPSLPPRRWNRPCERSEGVRRLRHSLGCFSTLVPWAEKAPPPLQPLGLRPPDPASWYSGLCPCLPGTVFFSSLSQSVPTHPLGLSPPLLTGVLCSRSLTFIPRRLTGCNNMQLCKSCAFARRCFL